MRLRTFEVRGYKNFTQLLRLEGLGRINLIHGENNVGKSNLLEALGLFVVLLGQVRSGASPGRARRRGEAEDTPGTGLGSAHRVPWNNFERRGYPPGEIFYLDNRAPIEISAELDLDAAELQLAGLDAAALPVEVAVRLADVEEAAEVEITRFRLSDGADLLADTGSPDSVARSTRLLEALAARSRKGASSTPRMALLKADRSLWSELPSHELSSATHRVPVPRDLRLQLYDAKESAEPERIRCWERFVEILAQLEDLLGPGSFRIRYDRQEDEVPLWYYPRSGAPRPIHLLGSGIQQVVNVIGWLLTCGADIMAIEEPELNLRYLTQLRLRDMFRGVMDPAKGSGVGPAQLFLTSHSPAFEDEPCFYAMIPGEQGPSIERRPRQDAPDFTGLTTVAPTPGERAPASYVTSEGLVRLPENIRHQMGLSHGGGVFFLRRRDAPYTEMLTDEEFLAFFEPGKNS